MTKEFWDSRFSSNKHTYGVQPNYLFKQYIDQLNPGRILLPGEGEGRNAVYAAKKGWKVDAFDYSDVAVSHAQELAKENYVRINYSCTSIENFEAEDGELYDLIAIMYLHLPPEIREEGHRRLIKFLKPGGKLFVLGFAKEQLANDSGGPKEVEMLFSAEELKSDFQELKQIDVTELEYVLNEGLFHNGKANLIALTATK